MAIGDAYATLADFKAFKGSEWANQTQYDGILTTVLDAASREVERFCGRQFNTQVGETARLYTPLDGDSFSQLRWCETDDFVLTDGFVLQTDPGGNGTFEVTWSAPLDYELFPLNGVVDGEPGWPYSEIHAVGGVWFPLIEFRRKSTIKVTAQWGWEAVPEAVKMATLLIAAQVFKMKDAPLGVAGFTNFQSAIRVRDNPVACALIKKYQRGGADGPMVG